MASTFIGTANHGSQELLDYSIDWNRRLTSDGDTISVSTWNLSEGPNTATVGDGINGAPAPSVALGIATVWLLPGTVGHVYHLTNKITTTGGRIYEGSIEITVINR